MSDRGPLGWDDDQEEPRGRPAPDIPPPARPPGSRASWLVGVVAVAILAYISINTIRTVGNGAPGSHGLPADVPLPPFAVPLATSSIDKDADVARESGSGQQGKVAACDLRGAQILNVCQLAERGPVVLGFLATPSAKCVRQMDIFDRVRAGFPGVQFAGIGIRGGRGKLREDIRGHGWGFPVGWDRDGVVSNVYAVAVCPTVTFAYPGGIVMRSTVGVLDETKLRAQVRALVRGARERGWTPPA